MLNDQERRISQLETESAALKAVLRSRHTKSSVLSPYNCSVNSRNIDEASGRSRIVLTRETTVSMFKKAYKELEIAMLLIQVTL